MRRFDTLFALSLLTSVACHPGPVINTGPPPPDVGGTIAGIVSTTAKNALMGRKVTAIETQSGKRFEATTAVNGGYTIKVPEGTYRLEVELQPGEVVAKQPEETRVDKSDLDPQRHFEITVQKPSGTKPSA